MNYMKDYILGKEHFVFSKTNSKGTQTKYFKNGFWYKVDKMGKEGLVEELTSKILSCSNISNFVMYDRCLINGKQGCISKNFLEENEIFVSFQKLYQNYIGGSLADKVFSINTVSERFKYLVDLVQSITDVDCSDYLKNIISLDLLILNPDRHFYNIGIIYNSETEKYREAPIFDNGQGLFQNYSITPPDMKYKDAIENICAATISGSFEEQALVAGNNLKIDYDKLHKLLKDYPDGKIKDTLLKQLNKYKNLFKEEPIVKFTDIINSSVDFTSRNSDDDYLH